LTSEHLVDGNGVGEFDSSDSISTLNFLFGGSPRILHELGSEYTILLSDYAHICP